MLPAWHVCATKRGAAYLEVLTNETNSYDAELDLSRARLNEMLALVQVYNRLEGLAIGGVMSHSDKQTSRAEMTRVPDAVVLAVIRYLDRIAPRLQHRG